MEGPFTKYCLDLNKWNKRQKKKQTDTYKTTDLNTSLLLFTGTFHFIVLRLKELWTYLKVALLFENWSLLVYMIIWTPGDLSAPSGVKHDTKYIQNLNPTTAVVAVQYALRVKFHKRDWAGLTACHRLWWGEPVSSSHPPVLITYSQPALWPSDQIVSRFKSLKEQKKKKSICSWVTWV